MLEVHANASSVGRFCMTRAPALGHKDFINPTPARGWSWAICSRPGMFNFWSFSFMSRSTSRRQSKATHLSLTAAASTTLRSVPAQARPDLFLPASVGTHYDGLDNPFGVGACRRRQKAIPEGYGFTPFEAEYGPSPIRVAHALALLSPDCDDATWTTRRLMPLAHAARRYPALAFDFLYIAELWSSGALVRQPAQYWDTPDPTTGQTRRAVFGAHWVAMSKRRYLDTSHCIGTIYFDAEKAALAGRRAPELSIEYDQLSYYFPEWRVARDEPSVIA